MRACGLDVPEVAPPRRGRNSRMEPLIAGQQLTRRQRGIDRYGRIVGQCILPDARDVAEAMIASGTATEHCRFGERLRYLLNLNQRGSLKSFDQRCGYANRSGPLTPRTR
jgi:endonuclease YncB( thermonuclease family)